MSLLGFGVLLLGAGCKTGYQRAQSTMISLSELRDEITAARQQIIITVNALNRMYAPEVGGSLEGKFEMFRAQVREAEAQRRRVHYRTDKVITLGTAYFDQWEKEIRAIANLDARQMSDKRREETLNHFWKLSDAMRETKKAYAPFITDIQDIERHLSTDLTQAGLEAVRPIAKRANRDAKVVLADIDRVLESLDRVQRALQPQATR